MFTCLQLNVVQVSLRQSEKYDVFNQCITLMKCELIDVEMMVIPDYGYNL